MKVIVNREGFLEAFGAAVAAVPARSPKPVLQNVLFRADQRSSVLVATNLEIGLTVEVLGVKLEEPGQVLLPTGRFGQILRSSTDDEFAIESAGNEANAIEVRGLRCNFKLASDDPKTFPCVPAEVREHHYCAEPSQLARAIRRTMFATDPESTRYALGGTLWEIDGGAMWVVGTDGRRLARQEIAVERVGQLPEKGAATVLPVKALRVIEAALQGQTEPVQWSFDGNTAITLRAGRTTVYTRLVEGRFPRYQDVFPTLEKISIPLSAQNTLRATKQAGIFTSDDSRSVVFSFDAGVLTIDSQSPDIGSSRIEVEIIHLGPKIEICFDPRYLVDALATLDPSVSLEVDLFDEKTAAVLRTDDGYTYVVMPLTRDR